jgi:hypothetical protein
MELIKKDFIVIIIVSVKVVLFDIYSINTLSRIPEDCDTTSVPCKTHIAVALVLYRSTADCLFQKLMLFVTNRIIHIWGLQCFMYDFGNN